MPTVFEQPQQPKELPDTNPSLKAAVEAADKLMHTRPKSMGLFAAFAKQPKGVAFVNQEPDEAILLFLRKHFITNIPWIATTFFLALIPPLLFLFLSFFPFVLPQGLTIVLVCFYYLVIITYAFSNFTSWFYNIGIITQKRIIDLDSLNILAHNTTTANFDEIVDVKFDQHGFLQSTFDYGNIHLQTEAIKTNFEFDATPKPSEVTDIISDLRVAQKGIPHGIHH